MLPPFELLARLRPVSLVSPRTAQRLPAGEHPLPRPAPFAAARVPVDRWQGPDAGGSVSFRLGGFRLEAWVDDTRRTGLTLHGPRGAVTLRSRRHGRLPRQHAAGDLGISLTGRHVCVWSRPAGGPWTVRARADLATHAPGLDPYDPALLAGLQVSGSEGLVAGGFGQLGFRDVRVVGLPDGTPVREDGKVLLSATHAGPGFFDTGHTGVWALDPETLELEHRSDLYFTRTGDHRVHGDHATHVLRADGGGWLVATSTWSDFDLDRPDVRCTLARTDVDVTRGEHVLATTDLTLPTTGLGSVGTWDPHLAHDGERWLVGFVSATAFFRFGPALAGGTDLADLALLGADTSRRATEGSTLFHDPEVGGWRLLASDGPDSVRSLRRQYPVFDLAVGQVGHLDAPHLGNIPWPTLFAHDGRWFCIGFDGTPAGGGLVGYGTHGDLVVSVTGP